MPRRAVRSIAGRGLATPRGRRCLAALAGALVQLALFALPVPAQKITLAGSLSTFTVNNAVAGEDLTPVINASTNYSVDTKKQSYVTAHLNSALPSGVVLLLTLTAPSGATSAGAVALTTTPQVLVANIPQNLKANNLTVRYELRAAPQAGLVSLSSRTMTLTLSEY